MTIELTEDEYAQLLLLCGYATGAASKAGEEKLAQSFLVLDNTINRNNPHWKPYAVPIKKED